MAFIHGRRFASACGCCCCCCCCFWGGLLQHSSVWLRAWIPFQVGWVSPALQRCFYALSVVILCPVSCQSQSHLPRVHACPPPTFPPGFQLLAHFTLKRSIPSFPGLTGNVWSWAGVGAGPRHALEVVRGVRASPSALPSCEEEHSRGVTTAEGWQLDNLHGRELLSSSFGFLSSPLWDLAVEGARAMLGVWW